MANNGERGGKQALTDDAMTSPAIGGPAIGGAGGPGKRTLTEGLIPAPPMQRKTDGEGHAAANAAPPASGGGGRALTPEVRGKMEQSFGADFSAVRVHEGPQAEAMGALAYAQGTDLHFAPGQYAPESARGQELIGHELAHVVQQSEGRVNAPTQAKGAINADPSLEAEADTLGTKAARGQPARPGASSGAPLQPLASSAVQLIQRYPSEEFLFSRIRGIEGGMQGGFIRLDRDDHIRTELRGLLVEARGKGWAKAEAALEKLLDEKTPALQLAAQPSAGTLSSLDDNLKLGKTWKNHEPGLGARVEKTFTRIQLQLANAKGRIEVNGELLRLVNNVVAPLLSKNKNAPKDAKEQKKASESLAELDYAAIVMDTKELAQPMVLGAKGEIRNEGQKETKPEESHGNLPPLNVPNMEVDSYYATNDQVLHADEVKDTPNALADKAKKGEQINRQVAWLKSVSLDKNLRPYTKQVGYFVQAGGPKFENVLSEDVIANLTLIDAAQQTGLPFLNIAGQPLTITALNGMYEQAKGWLMASKPVLDAKKMKFSAAATTYFGDLATAQKTIAAGPLKAQH